MKITLRKEQSILDYARDHANSRAAFSGWLTALGNADWDGPQDIRHTFRTVDIIASERVVFNIGGNNFRMICSYRFGPKKSYLFVKWIGTHDEYNKLCDRKEQYTVSIY